jgi:hypothetical protein
MIGPNKENSNSLGFQCNKIESPKGSVTLRFKQKNLFKNGRISRRALL